MKVAISGFFSGCCSLCCGTFNFWCVWSQNREAGAYMGAFWRNWKKTSVTKMVDEYIFDRRIERQELIWEHFEGIGRRHRSPMFVQAACTSLQRGCVHIFIYVFFCMLWMYMQTYEKITFASKHIVSCPTRAASCQCRNFQIRTYPFVTRGKTNHF